MNTTTTLKHQGGNGYQAALVLASRMLQAKIVKDARDKKLCICLETIGDNGPCPVHGKGFTGGSHDKATL